MIGSDDVSRAVLVEWNSMKMCSIPRASAAFTDRQLATNGRSLAAVRSTSLPRSVPQATITSGGSAEELVAATTDPQALGP